MSVDLINISELPDPESARRFLARLEERTPGPYRRLMKDRSLLSDVLTLVSYSPLLAETMLQHPEYIAWLGRKRKDGAVRDKQEMLESLARFSLTNSQLDPHRVLSRFRRRELLRIYLRDIRRLATIAEITEELSNLADAILEHALRISRQELENRFGPPQESDDKGRLVPSHLCIVSLGKLGSRELNYSSDIDLLFLYSDEGTTAGVGRRDPITNREYFVKLAELVAKMVGEATGEGPAYRVDLRLRPNGRVGPLAMSVKETARYYTERAQAWERQVLIRSRSSAGNEDLFKDFFQRVEPSVFVEDQSVSEALRNVRESKQRIDIELINSKGINVKLGKGGIREIEFIAQALQLAYGGRDKWLRAPHTLICISRLADRSLITEDELTKLVEGYAFLRQLEHVLQMEHGLQTHIIPNDKEKLERLAVKMHCIDLIAFTDTLAEHMQSVQKVFRRIFYEEGASFEPSTPLAASADLYSSEIPANTGRLDEGKETNPVLEKVISTSPRFGELVGTDAAIGSLLSELLETGQILEAFDPGKALMEAVSTATELGDKLARLRRNWRNFLAMIMASDALERISVKDAKRLQTKLAEASINAGLAIARSEIEKRNGASAELGLAVMGLGKLGGAGVDYDSDLDLVLVYDEQITDQELASRAVEVFVNALSAITRDGSLYRVDLRLRPYGKDGPLAVSRSAFIEYVKVSAAIWELLAFVKMRAVGGAMEMAKILESDIRNIIHERALAIDPDALATETRRIRAGLEQQRLRARGQRDIDIKYVLRPQSI
ncbi:hypothetical protein [Leptolyngbya sp. 7M]|uniref:[protein-PII] uridylyltransferase family protein n=1 Tax=Leptolyngbya sp. 7M TaxID=2812896 RepID=UPI001B8D4B93|nr:hypothetical protein [Leptolyngbya sp. 7M]QYO66033.1 hypothetical protein JVX88_04325 [Leptolyngbya sp. 7M]